MFPNCQYTVHEPTVSHFEKSVTIWESVTLWGVTLWGHALYSILRYNNFQLYVATCGTPVITRAIWNEKVWYILIMILGALRYH